MDSPESPVCTEAVRIKEKPRVDEDEIGPAQLPIRSNQCQWRVNISATVENSSEIMMTRIVRN